MTNYYLLTEQIVDPESGEVLGRSGEENPQRLMEYLAWYDAGRPDWLQAALNTCYQSNSPLKGDDDANTD